MKKETLKSLIPYVVIIIVVVLIRTFIITPVRVMGDSMLPTLKNGEIMLLKKIGKIERFDIVVVHDSEDQEDIIKRVIALPNETIEIRDNQIFVNNQVLEENFGSGATSDMPKVTLAEDEYFVLGDNRLVSKDSRILGPIKKKHIKGTTDFVMFPFNKIGKVK